MNHLFANKYAQMKAAGQHADVCLLNTQEGWITFGKDAEIFSAGLVREWIIQPPNLPKVIKDLTDAGHSVALLDYWSPSLAVKPQPTLIVRLEGKVTTEDWI